LLKNPASGQCAFKAFCHKSSLVFLPWFAHNQLQCVVDYNNYLLFLRIWMSHYLIERQ
jgi:hypothetical protein